MSATTTVIERALWMSLALALVWAPLAVGHASLVRAMPDAGSAVHESPAKLRLWFSGPLEPAFSTVEVLDRSEKRVDNGDPEVGGDDRQLLQVSMPRLP